VWFFPQGAAPGFPWAQGQEAELATGGALATGKVCISDGRGGADGATTRKYDNFMIAVPTTDAAVYASQSLEIRHDRVIREDSTGTLWVPVSKYVGDYCRVPVAGKEARTLRGIVKLCRNDPFTMADTAIDDASWRLSYRPRYLQVPRA